MAEVAKWYGRAVQGQYGGASERRVDWVGDTVKVALFTSSFTPDQDAQDFFDDVAAHETTGTGYTQGGATLVGKVAHYDAASNVMSLRADPTIWGGGVFSVQYAVVYKDTGAPGTSPLLGYFDFGGVHQVVGGSFAINWHPTDGVLRIVVS